MKKIAYLLSMIIEWNGKLRPEASLSCHVVKIKTNIDTQLMYTVHAMLFLLGRMSEITG